MNDVLFSIHALLATLFTVGQCIFFEVKYNTHTHIWYIYIQFIIRFELYMRLYQCNLLQPQRYIKHKVVQYKIYNFSFFLFCDVRIIEFVSKLTW